MQEFSGREARWFDEYAHYVSNCIVWDALRTGSTHVAFEDLSYIRDNIANAKKFQQWLFDRVYEYVEYKLVPFGVRVEQVGPEDTSKGCSDTACGYVAEANREGKHFECGECGLTLNADYNAARNIGLRFADDADQPGRTCQAGRATSQLALKSGTLTPDGAFESRDWVSTDKPTASAVGS